LRFLQKNFLVTFVLLSAVFTKTSMAGPSMLDKNHTEPYQSTPSRYVKNEGAINNAWDLPDIVLKGLDGKTHRLSDWKGKIILLNFWATWCRPCQKEIPEFINWQNNHTSEGLQIVSIGLDEPQKLRNFSRTLGINYPILLADPNQQQTLLLQWGNSMQALPFTIVIGQDGHLHFMRTGEFDEEAFDAYIKPLLQKNTTNSTQKKGRVSGVGFITEAPRTQG